MEAADVEEEVDVALDEPGAVGQWPAPGLGERVSDGVDAGRLPAASGQPPRSTADPSGISRSDETCTSRVT